MTVAKWFQLSILVFFLLSACGRNEQSKPVVEIPDSVQEIVHPDLTDLEPVALQSMEAQKQQLSLILAKEDATDLSKSQAYGKTGILYHALNFFPAAETAYLNAHLMDPNNFQWPYFLGKLYQDLNQPDPQKAAVWYDKAHGLKNDFSAIKTRLAEALRTNGQLERAKVLYEEAVVLDAKNALATAGLGHIAVAENRYEEAINHFKAAIGKQARASSLHYPLSQAYQALDKAEEAQKELALRGKVEPFLDDPFMAQINEPKAMTHYRMAETLRVAEQFEQAAPHYDLVVQLKPTEPGPRMGRALNLIRMGRHFDAVVNLQDDITVFPGMFPLHHILARLSATSPDDRVRDGTRAIALLSSLQRAGRTAELTETLAMAFAELGRFEEAVLAQERAIEIAREGGEEAFAEKLQKNLEIYKAGKPCREPWPPDDPLFKMVTIGR